MVTPYVLYIQLSPFRPSFSEPDPKPQTLLEVVTVTVVDAPAASVTDVDPDDVNTTDWICGTPDSVSTAVRVELLTFVTRKTLVSVRADATVPKSSDRVSTFPEAADEIGVTEK
jgi:hypothetical protein